MRNTRFIFVEGIMGAGKSTTVETLSAYLDSLGINNRPLWEGPTEEERDHPLRIATMFPHPQAIWKDLTVRSYVEVSVRMWKNFSLEAEQSATVTVCDGLLFHGNMTDLLLMDAPRSVLDDYLGQVLGSIAHLRPVLIYLRPGDVVEAIHTVIAARGMTWEQYQVDWKTNSPYGIRRDLKGLPGLIRLYESYRDLCDEMFDALNLPKLPIHADGDWDAHYRDILAFLELPHNATS